MATALAGRAMAESVPMVLARAATVVEDAAQLGGGTVAGQVAAQACATPMETLRCWLTAMTGREIFTNARLGQLHIVTAMVGVANCKSLPLCSL